MLFSMRLHTLHTLCLLSLFLSFIACTKAQQQKTGLTILNAVVMANGTAVKAIKEIDLEQQGRFIKRYDTIQASPNDNIIVAENALLKIDADRSSHERRIRASYDFLEALLRGCEAAKISLLAGANLANVLAPVIGAAIAAEKGLQELGVKSNFVSLLTGGK